MDMETDATCVLANHRAILQRIIDASNAIRSLHRQEEAGGQLLTGCACVKVRRRGVDKVLVAQQVVGLKGFLQVHRAPQRQGHSHHQMLRALQRLALRVAEEVLKFLQCLESEIVQMIVPLVINAGIDGITMRLAQADQFLRHIGNNLSCFFNDLMGQFLHHVSELIGRILMVV